VVAEVHQVNPSKIEYLPEKSELDNQDCQSAENGKKLSHEEMKKQLEANLGEDVGIM